MPVRLHERREGYEANSEDSTLYGLETRLQGDREEVVAEGFPSDLIFNVEGQKFVGKIYAFNKYSKKNNTKVNPKKYDYPLLNKKKLN